MGKTCCAEPSLDELFRDIAVQILMRRDGVRESDIRALLRGPQPRRRPRPSVQGDRQAIITLPIFHVAGVRYAVEPLSDVQWPM